jgi:hypothetical protein
VLDGRQVPASLPWLGGNPMIGSVTRSGVLMSVFFWLAIIVLLYVGLYWMEKKPRAPKIADIPSVPNEAAAEIQS